MNALALAHKSSNPLARKLARQLDAVHASKARVLERSKALPTVMGDALVTVSSGALCGYVQGRYGGYKLFGTVPFELLLAAGFHGVGLYGPKRSSHQMHNLGNGALVAYTAAIARGFGKAQRAKAGEKPLLQGITDGIDALMGDSEGGGTLSTADLIAMAQRQ